MIHSPFIQTAISAHPPWRLNMRWSAAFFLTLLALAGSPMAPALNLEVPDRHAGFGSPDLPEMGASADGVMTPISEQRLGQTFMRSVRKAMKILDDPLVNDYIQSLGKRLVASAKGGGMPFSFFVVDDPQMNAFAGPSGYIGVFSGLILSAESESELAAVLAHEIAHVTQRHLLRTIEDQQKLMGPATALLIVAAILGAQVSADAGLAAAVGAQAAMAQHQINFTRDNEKEADRIGITSLAAAGFEPHAMPAFFERISKATRIYETNAPEFLRTHPVESNRIAEGLSRADQYGYRQRSDDLRYYLVRASLREQILGSPAKAVEYFTQTLAEERHRNEEADRYGLALALMHGNKLEPARQESKRLLGRRPNEVAYILLDAQIDQRSGLAPEALRKLTEALRMQPSSYPLLMGQAEVAMAAGQPKLASQALSQAARQRPEDARIQQMLSDAYLKQGNAYGVHRHLAERHYLEGQLETAVRQLEVGLRQSGLSYQEIAQLEQRHKELKAELDELKKAEQPFGRR